MESAFQGTSLDSLPGVTNSFFPSTSTSNSSDMSGLSSITAPYPIYQQLSDQFSQPAHSDFTLVKHKHKAAAGSSSEHEQLGVSAPSFPRPQKVLTLEKYRVKQAGELALQNGVKEELGAEVYASPAVSSNHHHHKRRSQQQQAGLQGEGRREKASSKKPRLAASYAENGSAAGEEFKMRIKVSSDHGGAVPGKDKHKEHSGHRHSKHGHSHSYALSGSSRGTADSSSFSVRAPSGHFNDGSSSGSSRKRQHADNNHHHHHHSKSSRSSKGGLGSAHYSSDGGQRTMELHHGHDGTNGMLLSNGQHTDYKNTFDMLDSLLSAQGMNL